MSREHYGRVITSYSIHYTKLYEISMFILKIISTIKLWLLQLRKFHRITSYNVCYTKLLREGTGQPEYAKCVAISTKGAQREMLLPSLLAIIVPIVIGIVFGVAGVVGRLMGGLTTGFTLAVFLNNAGGAWDNAKKYIEKGHYGGKGSEAHKAGVV